MPQIGGITKDTSLRFFSNRLIQIIAVAIVYFLAARLGLAFSFASSIVSPVWPATGIAIAAVLIFGYGVWPGIAIGSLLSNYWTEIPYPFAALSSIGDPLEALSAAFLLRRFVASRIPLYKAGDVLKFVLFAGIGTAINATIGTTILKTSGFTHHLSYYYLWSTWWLGNVLGALVVAPFLLIWSVRAERQMNKDQQELFFMILLVAAVVDFFVFRGWSQIGFSLAFLMIPPVLLAAFRFHQKGATSSVLLCSIFAIWALRQSRYIPFQVDQNDSMLLLQVFTGIIAVTALILAAVLTERKQAETSVRESEKKYRTLAEQIPAVTYVAELGPMGRWFYVSPQMESLLGFSVQQWLADPENWYKQMHPEDRERILAAESQARQTGSRFRAEYRMFTRDGKLKWLRDEGLFLESSNQPGLYQGVMLDVTDKMQGEEELRKSRENYQALVDSLDGIVWQADSQMLQFSFISKQAERLLGYSEDCWLNEPDFWKTHIHPQDRDSAMSLRLRASSERRDHQSEYRMIAEDGRTVWMRDIVSVAIEKEGSVTLRGVMVEITKRKEAEALQSALYRIAEITSSALDMPQFYSTIHTIVGELMYARNLYIALYDERTDLITFPYFVDEMDHTWLAHKPGKGVTAYVLRTGKPLLATKERFEEMVKEGLLEEIGPSSVDWLGVPLKTEGKTIGVLAVQCYSENIRFGEKEKEILTFVSQNIATALQRRRAEESLRTSEEQYRRFFEEDLTGDYISTVDGRLLECNQAYATIFGFHTIEEALKSQVQSLYFDPEQRLAFLRMLQKERKLEYFESTLRRRDGETVHVIENAIGIFDDNDRLVQIRGYMFDITEHKKLEEQLRQAQKMKAIGQLAGGVAHDFNNTLMAITGYCDLLLMKLNHSDPLRQDVLEIQKAAAHGASLTRQLLAFSRKQIMATKVLDLNRVIVNMHKMLSPLIGEKIELVSALDPRLRSIKADPGQIEQVIVNLAVNARDAMTDGGKLTIETTNVHLDEAYARLYPDATPGHYVMLTFADTGCGMSEATQSQIFEPFFTTKEGGTGLGLATVHGIIHQSGGHITVQSETGKGSTFRIYLPAVSQQVEDAALSPAFDSSIACWQTVLLVDDNESLRAAVASFLRVCGFKIFEAANGHEALEVAERLDSSIDVLLTDIVMPRMNGQELARRLVDRNPRIKILYMTGYAEEAAIAQRSLRDSEEFIMKPFPMRTLVNKIHQLFS